MAVSQCLLTGCERESLRDELDTLRADRDTYCNKGLEQQLRHDDELASVRDANAKVRGHYIKLYNCFNDLHTMVNGECPSLLENYFMTEQYDAALEIGKKVVIDNALSGEAVPVQKPQP